MNDLCTTIKSPYFGRIDFKFGVSNEELSFAGEERTFYIGKHGLDLPDYRITDWRAPIAGLYYSFPRPTAEAFYKVDKNLITGELTKKHMIEIKEAELLDVFDSSEVESLVGADPFLLQQLKGKSSSKLKDIVSSIQSEQNVIISAEPDEDIIVQGVAGSGKTSIATHRLSWLLYNYKNEIFAKKCLIVAPSRLFLSYIAEILPEIGSEKVPQKTFDEWALYKLRDVLKKEDLVDSDDRQTEKGSFEFLKKVEKLGESIKQKNKNLRLVEVLSMYKSNLKISSISKHDLAALVYLKTLVQDILHVEKIDYLVVDEAQDYTPAQLLALKRYTKTGRMMIVGDLMQGIINPHGIKIWGEVYGTIFDKNKTKYFNIQTSYRTTKEIVAFVNKYMLDKGVPAKFLPKAVLREGPEPTIIEEASLEDLLAEAPKIIANERQELRQNIVFIAPKEYLQMFYDELKAVIPELKLIDEPDDLYEGGIVITDVKTVKGLEFDSVVFLHFPQDDEPDVRLKEYYVACTRAMHKLYVLRF